MIAAVQFMNNKAIKNINTKGQSNIKPVMLELVAPFITAPAFSSALNSSPLICVSFIFLLKASIIG